jgi:hypothetical protein
MTHRIFTGRTDDDHEVLVQLWDEDDATVAEVAFRSTWAATWGPPVSLTEQPS